MRARRRRATPSPVQLLLAALLLLLVGAVGAAPVLQLDDSVEHVDLTRHFDLLGDPKRVLDVETVASERYRHQFAPLQRDEVSRYAGGDIWLRFALHNNTDHTLLRAIDVQPGADYGPLALYQERGLRTVAPQQLPLLNQSPRQFLLQIQPHSRELYYLQMRTSGVAPPYVQLLTLDQFTREQSRKALAHGLAWGLLLALLTALLVAAVRHRSIIYLWIALEGLLPQLALWLLPAQPEWRTHIVAIGLLLNGGCVLRTSLLLGAFPEASRLWRRVLVTCAIATLASPLLLLLSNPLAPAMVASGLLLLLSCAASLHAYLVDHGRFVLGYALVRLSQLLLGLLLLIYVQTLPAPLGSAPTLMVLSVFGGVLLLLMLLARHRGLVADQEAQRQLVAVAEAESRARTEVIAEVGHRVRTPVSGVLGMLEMLQDTPLTPVQRDYLSTIQRAGNELLNAVNDLSDVSRLEARRSGLEQTRFDLPALVAETLDGFRGLAANRGLELITDQAPQLPQLVSGDPTRLRQILLQLMHHAVSSCENGEVVLSISPSSNRDRLQFQLQARGSAPADAASPIERRINRPAPHLRPAVARQLVEMLGGAIELPAARPGLFEVRFELPLPAIDAIEPPDHLGSVLRNSQLLVVDDNATFCEMLKRQASHWGMAVQTAASIAEALAWLRTQATIGHRVDLIVADAELPELAEDEWFGRLLETHTPAPALILLCSQPTLPDDERLRALGVRRLLTKPINQTSLQLTLEEELTYAEQPRPSIAATLPRVPLRCLVAEDNVINARVLLGMLEKLGVQATVVNNGQQAVEASQRQDFDIVLMDCDMPIMDGFEAARRIREVQSNRGRVAMPIIALTANTVEELGERARNPVMDAHLVKPIHLRELRALLERWTGRAVAAP